MSDQAWHLRKLVHEHLKCQKSNHQETDGLVRVLSVVSLEEDFGASAVAQAWASFLSEKNYRVAMFQPGRGMYWIQKTGDVSKVIRWNFEAVSSLETSQLEKWSRQLDFLVINTAAHPLASAQNWVEWSDTLVMVAPFQKEAVVKAYTWLKLLLKQSFSFECLFLLNEVKDLEAAKAGYLKLAENMKKFLSLPVTQGGVIPFDPYFQKEDLQEGSESTLYPLPRAARALKIIADQWAQYYASPLFLNQPFFQRMTKLHHYLQSVKNSPDVFKHQASH